MSPAVRRAGVLLAVAVLLATACTLLGRWQWNRHVWRDAKIAVVKTNYAAEPVPLADVLGGPGTTVTDADEWRRVVATGHYEADAAVLLRNRPVDGNAAYHVLVPFVVEDASAGTAADPTDAGTVLVVDRGWVPLGADGSDEVRPPDPPTGTVTLTARLRPAEKPSSRTAPAGQVQSISVDQVLSAAAGGGTVDRGAAYDAYGQMVTEDPAAAVSLGALEPPSTDPGSHLSYAFQWWTFALGGLVAFSVAAYREVAAERSAGAGTPAGPRPERAPAPDVPRRRGGRAEDEEDALIDAQLSGDATGRQP